MSRIKCSNCHAESFTSPQAKLVCSECYEDLVGILQEMEDLIASAGPVAWSKRLTKHFSRISRHFREEAKDWEKKATKLLTRKGYAGR